LQSKTGSSHFLGLCPAYLQQDRPFLPWEQGDSWSLDRSLALKHRGMQGREGREIRSHIFPVQDRERLRGSAFAVLTQRLNAL